MALAPSLRALASPRALTAPCAARGAVGTAASASTARGLAAPDREQHELHLPVWGAVLGGAACRGVCARRRYKRHLGFRVVRSWLHRSRKVAVTLPEFSFCFSKMYYTQSGAFLTEKWPPTYSLAGPAKGPPPFNSTLARLGVNDSKTP